MSTDWRALCAELLDEVAARPLILDRELIDRARAALAAEADGPAVQSREPASVACEPSDGDLLQLMPEQFRADLSTVSRMAAHGAGPDIKPGLFRVSLNTGALEYARAVLARWGHQPAERVATPVGPMDEDLLHIATVALTVSDIKPADIKAETELYLYGREVVEVARAALARYGHQPAPPADGEVAEGPTPSDEELLKLARAELNNSPNWEEPEYDASNPFPYEAPGIAWLNFARAVLARGGRPAPAPAGEVAESSVAPVPEPALARINGILSDSGRVLLTDVRLALELAREALQQRQTAPVPVAWCNSGEFLAASAKRQSFNGWLEQHSDCDMALCIAQLPAHALPLPSGEV